MRIVYISFTVKYKVSFDVEKIVSYPTQVPKNTCV